MPATRILVTGGAGFIGSNMVRRLLADGHEVTVLDDLSTGRAANLADVADHPALTFQQGSVLDELRVDELVHENEVVVHLAAAVGVKLIMSQPLRSFTTNIRGSEIIFESAHRYRRKVLLSSTSEIYGKSTDTLTETSDRILGSPSVTRWAYSTSKAVDEIMAFAYHKERGLPTVIVRLFNTVGPGQSPAYGMVIPRLVRQALAGEPMTVYGTGMQRRCFCHVHDAVEAMVGLLGSAEAVGDVFNVGSTEETTIMALAERIRAETNSESEIVLVPYDQAYPAGFEDLDRRTPDTAKIEALLGWQRARDLDGILEDTIRAAAAELASDGAPRS